MAITLDNFVRSVLSQDATAADNQLVLALAAAPLRDPPAASAAGPGVLILQDAPTAPTKIEVIRYTGRTIAGGNVTLTGVTRGLEGTTPQAWSAGTPTFQGWTAGVLAEIMNGTAAAALRLANPRTVALSGVINATGVPFDGTANITLATTIADGALTISKTSGLQAALDNKLNLSGGTLTGTLRMPFLQVGANANGAGTVDVDVGSSVGRILMRTTTVSGGTTVATIDAVSPTNSAYAQLNLNGSSVTIGGQTIWTSGNFTPSNYAPLSGASFSGSVGFNAPINVNASIKVTGGGTAFNGQGSYISWNRLNGIGEMDFINHRGGGSGGFYFFNTDGSTYTQLSYLGADSIWRAADFQATSDLTVKHGIKTLRRGVAALKEMPPIEYTIGGKRQIGYGAQHALKVIPEAVSRDAVTGLLQLSYGQVSALLGSAILEVEHRLSMLERR